MSNKPIFSHYCDLYRVSDELLPSMLAELKDNGVRNLVFLDAWITRLLKEPEFFGMLKYHLRNDFNFFDMHAPYGEAFDLACISEGRREELIKNHIRALGYASDLGCKTYTIHIGAYYSVFFHTPNDVLRPLAVRTLEKLIPAAEKYGIILAVENAFERSNTPEEVMYYINYFNHPNVKCCFDSGHALIMTDYPGKTGYDNYMTDEVWSNQMKFFNNAFEIMAPAIVTCHLHDNNGFSDQHRLPGIGTEKWDILTDKLRNNAPALLSIQSEASILGKGHSIRHSVETYRKLFPDLL